MKKIFVVFILFFTKGFSEESANFYPSVSYDLKKPIEIESNLDVINFGTIIYGSIGRVYGHKIRLNGTGKMKLVYVANRNLDSLGIKIIQSSENYIGQYEKEIGYEYFWDTSQSEVKDLKGTEIIFTAYYDD